MCNGKPAGHPELWTTGVTLPEDIGPLDNLQLWQDAEDYLDHLCQMHEAKSNGAILTALVDAYNRCIEERRRAEDLLKLHEKWGERRIGGVVEPDSPVRD
jgi:hypothetical protein